MKTLSRWKWKGSLRMPQSIMYVFGALVLLLISQIGSVSGSTYDEDEWTNWSDWSPCSRTCDGGITQQFRRCKSPHGCHGVSIRRKMCNMQPCSEPRDYRNEQCRAFNGKEYRGKRYTWEAIEDPDNPCALICRAERTDLIAKLSPKLRDGTRCRIGSLHVCVDGRCEAVGCDLKLGSPKKVDECGICGGDGSKCTSPVYTWQTLPTGPCTLNCGGGQQPVKVVCRNSLTSEVVDHFLCNTASKPHRLSQSCNIHPCEPGWQAGEWSLCSVTCGGGLRIRKVFCAQEKNGTKIQVAEKLCAHIRKPSNQEPCNLDTCPYWHAGPWSLCSVSCGKGYKTRNVVCRDAMNLPSSACDPELKPADMKTCTDQPVCPGRVATTTSTTTSTTTLAPTALVISRTGPTKKRRVKTTPPEPPFTTTDEGRNKNFMEPFSSQFPDSYPTDYDNEAYFAEALPREHTLPLVQPYPPMDNAIPSEPTFVAEEWGPCSQTCGEGIRTREVKCKIFLEFSRTIANLPDKECPGPKPPETETCFARPCTASQEKEMESFQKLSDSQQALQPEPDPSSLTSNYRNKNNIAVGLPPGISTQDMSFSWKVVGYSPCSASCLGGIQEAMIQCVRDYDQRIATPVLCMDKPQPDIATTRTCNDHPCPPRWNVSDFGPCSKPCGAGVMIREVNCIHEVTRGNTVIVPNSICPPPPPKPERLCNAVHCPPYWEAGDWSRCSKPCGGGERTRPLYCKQITSLGQITDLPNGERHCPQHKPIDSRPCNQKACSTRKGGKQTPGLTDSMGASMGSTVGRSHAYMQQEWKKRISLTARGHATVYNGILLKLRCPTGKGVDRTRLVWMRGHDFVNIQPHKLEVLDKHGILKIRNTTFSDSGIYTCLYNGRPVSNITLMVRPYTGPINTGGRLTHGDKGLLEKGSAHDSTLFADQQPGVSVPVSYERESIITPNSKIFSDNSPVSTSSSARLHSPFCFLSSFYRSFSSVVYEFSWLWPLAPVVREPTEEAMNTNEVGESQGVDEVMSFTTGRVGLRQDGNKNEINNFVSPIQEEIEGFGEVKTGDERKRKWKEEEGEETLEEMIGMKTKVFTSTIIAPLGDTFPTTFKSGEGRDGSTPTSITASDLFNSEFGLDLVTEDSAQALLPTHASLSTTSTTTAPSQAVDYYDAVGETTKRTDILEETTIGQQQQSIVISKTEIIEPFLLECMDSEENVAAGQPQHPRRHGHHRHHNSNYNRYRSNRRRRRWRNNHNGLNNDNDTSLQFKPNDGKRSAISCSTSAISSSKGGDNNPRIEGKGYQLHPDRRGVWKVGNWTVCDTKECFTWNTALRKRELWCVYRNGSNAAISICDSAIKPIDTEECYNPECRGLWETENWSQCTAQCEEIGFKTRILKCIWNGSQRPAGHACHSLPRPQVKKSCRGQPCTPLNNGSSPSETSSSFSSEDRRYLTNSNNNFNEDKIRKINLDDPLLSSTSNTEDSNPKQAYNRRRLISEQSLRSRLSMLDRNTLLEEFLRFFHHYYYSDHNQKGDNHDGYRASSPSASHLEDKRDNLNNFNNDNNVRHSSPDSSSVAGYNGHNSKNSRRYSLQHESNPDEYGDY